MLKSKRIFISVCVVTLALGGMGSPAARAQDANPPAPPAGGPGGRRNFDPQQFQKMMTERIKDRLGVSDQEWTALEPKIEKVIAAQREAMGGMGMGMGMLFRPGGTGPGADTENPSPLAKAAKDLQASIDANAGADELATRMAAYRAAQEKARQNLSDARTSLKELLTHKQEAVLLMIGLLD